MSEAIHGQFWNDQLETLITEIARQAMVAKVPLASPGIVEAMIAEIRAALLPRFAGKLGGPAGG